MFFYCLSLLRFIQRENGISGVVKCTPVPIRSKMEYKIYGGLIIQSTFRSVCCLTVRFINIIRNNLILSITE